MSTKYKINDPEGIYYLTCATVYWVDAFSRREIKEIITGSLQYCIANKGLNLHAYVIMSNHIHLVVSAEGESKL
ncbi:MAG: transposase, partial [Bacteroidia bacterium]